MATKGPRLHPEGHSPRSLADTLPSPSPDQVILGISDVIKKIQELQQSRERGAQSHFNAGRIHGLTQALAMVYGLPFSLVNDLLQEGTQDDSNPNPNP
jgi:hypothetical protein